MRKIVHAAAASAAAALLAAPAAAQDRTGRWQVEGAFDVTVAGEARTLHVIEDTEGVESSVTVRRTEEGTVIALTANDRGPGDAPVRPSLTAVIGPFAADARPRTAELEYLTAKAVYMAGRNGGAPAELRDFEWNAETGALSFTVEAPEMREMNPSVPATKPARPLPGGETVALEGEFEGSVPTPD